MTGLLGIIVFMPFAGFLILFLSGRFMKRSLAGFIGAGTIGISAAATIIFGFDYLISNSDPVSLLLWQWFDIDRFKPELALYIDPLSLIFMFVITFVGFLIHLYSVEYMKEDKAFSRFFAYMNLFIGSMLVLVLSDNFVFLYLGWEAVGVCSFLLIGFWYESPENNLAARKAFIITRIGDAAMIIGLFLLYFQFGTLSIHSIMDKIPEVWQSGSPLANAAALLLLAGAAGKSAQLPLQTWLPDAMAGPTPVSALIHAATMVAAGVYLIARSHMIFLFSPLASVVVAITGAATLLVAGLSALAQYDIKKVLAYSTISQIGYMFLGLGVGAWSAAVFHFMVHAFFKALLFLAAGVVILAMDHEQDIFRMGGLRKKMPWTFWTFLAGSASLSALPFISAGFYSKDQILFYTLEGMKGNVFLWLIGIAGAFITALYTFRMVFITFYGKSEQRISFSPGIRIKVVLALLAFFSITAGFINMPHELGGVQLFSGFLSDTLPRMEMNPGSGEGLLLIFLNSVLVLIGIYLAYYAFVKKPLQTGEYDYFSRNRHVFLRSGFRFDHIYDISLVKPFEKLAEINRNDIIDRVYVGISTFTLWLYGKFSLLQTGRLNWYLTGITVGVLVILSLIILL